MNFPTNIQKGVLWGWHQQINNWYATNDINVLMNMSFIREFYNKYEHRIKTIEEDINKIVKEYIAHDEHGKQIVEGEGVNIAVKFNEGKTPEDYQQAFQTYMNQTLVESNLVLIN